MVVATGVEKVAALISKYAPEAMEIVGVPLSEPPALTTNVPAFTFNPADAARLLTATAPAPIFVNPPTPEDAMEPETFSVLAACSTLNTTLPLSATGAEIVWLPLLTSTPSPDAAADTVSVLEPASV